MKKRELYLDANSTTPVHPEVLNAMLPYFTELFGNASSKTHGKGWLAAKAIEKAREQVAALIGAEKDEITFTAGATEALNIAIHGIASRYQSKGKHIISYRTEHKAVLEPLEMLAAKGFEISLLGVNSDGLPNLDELKSCLREDTILVAAMLANNETGVIFPVQEISALCKSNQTLFLCDATQAIGKIEVKTGMFEPDVLVYSAHKLYGPKGVGVVYKRRRNPRVLFDSLMQGGGQEHGVRPGTYNVPAIVGLGLASERATNHLIPAMEKVLEHRKTLEYELIEKYSAVIHGFGAPRLPNTINFHIPGIKAELLIRKLPHIAFSTGSACNSALPLPSHVLQAMHYSEKDSFSSVRFSLLSDFNEEDLHELLFAIEGVHNSL